MEVLPAPVGPTNATVVAGRDIQVDSVKHGQTLSITKVYIVEFDSSLDPRHVFGIGLVTDVRFCLQQIDYAFAARHGSLHGRVKLAQLLHGQKEAIDISQKRDHGAQGKRPAGHTDATKKQHDARSHDAEKLHCRNEDEGERNRFDVRVTIGLVDLVKSAGSAFFVGEGLDDADAAEVFRQITDEVGIARPRLAEGAFGTAGEGRWWPR